ncbi:MAG: hypothetical protein QM541_12720 [Flavobacterium sp.]|nr:hypothetical protein [Flavobacterium sp.]
MEKYTLKSNQIRWVHELIDPSDQQAIGEERSQQQHYLSNILNSNVQDDRIEFEVQPHQGNDNVNYAYNVNLDIQRMNGFYTNTVSNETGIIPVFEISKNNNHIFLYGLWNEHSGRNTNIGDAQSDGTILWRENWVWWAKIERYKKPIS